MNQNFLMQTCPKDYWIEKAIELGELKFLMDDPNCILYETVNGVEMIKVAINRALQLWHDIDFMKCSHEVPIANDYIIHQEPIHTYTVRGDGSCHGSITLQQFNGKVTQ